MRLFLISLSLVVLVSLVFVVLSPFGRIVCYRQPQVSSDLRAVETMLNLYHSDYGFYPSSLDELMLDKKFGPYLVYEPRDLWGRMIGYSLNSSKQAFILYSLGADGKKGGKNENADTFFNSL